MASNNQPAATARVKGGNVYIGCRPSSQGGSKGSWSTSTLVCSQRFTVEVSRG